MKVLYTAPNRAHHYRYASILNQAGLLYKFVSGFSRLSPRSELADINEKTYRSDFLQTLYVASLKYKINDLLSDKLGYLAKVQQDNSCLHFIKEAEIFLFYNGSGLNTCREAKKLGKLTIVEAVNSHISFQENILKEEYENVGITWKPYYEKEKERRLLEYSEADYILLPSEFVRETFLEYGFPENKLLKVPYGFDPLSENVLGQVNPRFNLKDSLTILYVGSISVRKGIKYLLEAFQKVKHQNKKLVLVGPMVDANAFDMSTLSDNVIFKGPLKGRELANEYKSSDIFCLPSVEEGLALVIGEALSFGIPIIATKNTGATDIIEDGREGYIVDIRNSNAIYEKVQNLIDNPALYEKIKSLAMQKANTLDGWQITGQNLVNVLNRLK